MHAPCRLQALRWPPLWKLGIRAHADRQSRGLSIPPSGRFRNFLTCRSTPCRAKCLCAAPLLQELPDVCPVRDARSPDRQPGPSLIRPEVEGRISPWAGGAGNSLRPTGRLAIVDFKADSPNGPPTQYRISPERVTEELNAAGYSLTETLQFLPRQYYLVFRNRDS